MSRLTRWLIALTAAMSFVGTAPAFAGTGSSVTVVAALSPATAHVGSTTVVTGVVGTRRSGVAVHVQHKVGHVWVGIGLVKTVAGGRFSVTVATPKKAAVWELRAVTATAVSGLMRQRVVIAAFAVRATAPVSVVAGTPIVVTGAVSRHASGSVTLQIYQAKLWHTLAVAKLSKASAFRFSSRRPAGSYAIRVVKAFTATTAGGVSAKLTVTVRPARDADAADDALDPRPDSGELAWCCRRDRLHSNTCRLGRCRPVPVEHRLWRAARGACAVKRWGDQRSCDRRRVIVLHRRGC